MDPLYVVDAAGKITYVNEPGARLFGSPVQSLKGSRIGDHYSTTGSTSGESNMARCLRTGETISGFETQLQISKTGEKFHVRGNIAPIKDSNNRITGAVLLLQDMTQIKKAEAAIRKANRRPVIKQPSVTESSRASGTTMWSSTPRERHLHE